MVEHHRLDQYWISTGFTTVVQWFMDLPGNIWAAVQTLWSNVITWGQQLFNWIWDGMKATAALVWDYILNWPANTWAAIQQQWALVTAWGSALFTWVWDGIKTVAVSVWQWFLDLPANLWGFIVVTWNTVTGWGSQLMSWVWDGIKTVAVDVWNWFLALPGSIWGFVQATWATVTTWGSSLINWIWDGIKATAVAVWDWFKALPGSIWETVKETWSGAFNWGAELVKSVIEGIKAGAKYVTAALAKVVSDAATAIVPGMSLAIDLTGIDLNANIDEIFRRAAGGEVWKTPGTGLFRGAGGPRDDLNRTLISDGEYIVNSKSTAKHLPLIEAINADQFATGGLVGDAGWNVGVQTVKSIIPEIVKLAEAERASGGSGYFGGGTGSRGAFLDAVNSKMGTSYVWGAAGPDVFDCSGLMSWGLEQAGFWCRPVDGAGVQRRIPTRRHTATR